MGRSRSADSGGRLIEASSDLYSNPITTLRKVTFPLSLPGVVSGTLLTFIPACGDYINAELLGTPKQYMIGNRIQQAYLVEKDYPLAASLSLILMAIVLLSGTPNFLVPCRMIVSRIPLRKDTKSSSFITAMAFSIKGKIIS